MADRMRRISEEIRKTVSEIIQNDLKDPRLPDFVSVLSASTTKDLNIVKIYISVLGGEKEQQDTMAALNSAKGYIRREIGNRLKLRATPMPVFELDNSIENGINMSKLINQLHVEKEQE